SAHGRKWRLLPRMTSLAFERFEQAGLFSADVRTGSRMQNDIEIEIGSEDFLSQKPFRLRLAQRLVQDAISQREFSPDVDEREVTIDGIGGDDHAFDQLVRVALENHAILAGARLTFIGVAAEVCRLAGILGNKAPL